MTSRSPRCFATQVEPGLSAAAPPLRARDGGGRAAWPPRRPARPTTGASRVVSRCGTAAAFVMLRLVALGIMAIAAARPASARTELRLAIANIHRPGALTPSLVLSLGLGVTLLVTLALIDGTIRGQLTRSPARAGAELLLPRRPATESERFDAFLASEAPGARAERVPMMRGRIVALKGVPARRSRRRRERRLGARRRPRDHLLRDLPEGSTLIEGEWWPADYDGPAARLARQRDRAGARPDRRRRDHRQRARPQLLTAQIANLRRSSGRRSASTS